MCAGGDGPRTLHDADDLVADAAPAVVDLIFENVDALDEERPRVIYDLSFLHPIRARAKIGTRADIR